MSLLIVIPGVISVLALLSAFLFNRSVVKQAQGTARMKELQGYIRSGAFTFMISEAKIMLITMAVIGIILWVLFFWQIAVAFWIGALLSMAAGFIGMNAATHANVRTAHAAGKSFKAALNVAFSGGSVMGLSVAGLALVGLVVIVLMFKQWFMPETLNIETRYLFGVQSLGVNFIRGALIVSAYSMGASLVALFDRVGGGIYTKAADMAADMVGKVEMNIPEDDPRNPATIADNVGDNVGDVGGLGADLFESFVGAIISVMVMVMYIFVGRANIGVDGLIAKLGFAAGLSPENYWWVLLVPLLIVGGGIVASFLAILYIRFSRRQEGMQSVLMNGTRLAALLTAITTFVVIWISPLSLHVFWQVAAGLLAGVGIGFSSEYFTSASYKPTKELAKMNQSGAAVGVTEGMALGMLSTFMPVVIIATATIISYRPARRSVHSDGNALVCCDDGCR